MFPGPPTNIFKMWEGDYPYHLGDKLLWVPLKTNILGYPLLLNQKSLVGPRICIFNMNPGRFSCTLMLKHQYSGVPGWLSS